MDKKVILISVDGMRPDGMQRCNNSFVKELEKLCTYNYGSRSVVPSITLPCHFSMSHSVPPQRHGILSNTYVPQVRPVKGIFEKVTEMGGVAGMVYGWDQIHDIASPGSIYFSSYWMAYSAPHTDTVLTDHAMNIIDIHKPDLMFVYMVETDEKGGHENGWMSEEYLNRINIAIENTKRLFDKYKDEYSIILMADHGGHDRSHGTEMAEDMTVPLFLYGPDFEKGKTIEDTSLLDIAPTIAKILGINPDPDWEGRALF